MEYSSYTDPLAFLNGRAVARDCIDCTNVATPACPSCPTGQTCVQSIQTCTSCVTTSCVATSSTGQSTTPAANPSVNSAPNTGAIAGGVIGGVVAIAAVVYLVWRFCIKNKRQPYEQEYWEDEYQQNPDIEKDFSYRRDQRASTHTVGSIASTVLTRASNIIQIAYIPGGTARSQTSPNGLLVPPVPPIPLTLAAQPSPAYTDEHFFMPGDLRNSSYSGMTSTTDRNSYATRNSMASTVYGRNAVVQPVQPQMIVRGKAAVVSVKPAAGGSTPPVPNIEHGRFTDEPSARAPSTFSVGSTFLNNASATQRKPQLINNSITKSIGTPTKQGEPETSAAVTPFESPFEDPEGASVNSSPTSSPQGSPMKRMGSLSDIINRVAERTKSLESSNTATTRS